VERTKERDTYLDVVEAVEAAEAAEAGIGRGQHDGEEGRRSGDEEGAGEHRCEVFEVVECGLVGEEKRDSVWSTPSRLTSSNTEGVHTN
jgi:hypothetical protein